MVCHTATGSGGSFSRTLADEPHPMAMATPTIILVKIQKYLETQKIFIKFGFKDWLKLLTHTALHIIVRSNMIGLCQYAKIYNSVPFNSVFLNL